LNKFNLILTPKYYDFFYCILASLKQADLINPPSLSIDCDCPSQTARIKLDWDGNTVTCNIANMIIHINNIDQEYVWKLNLVNIIEARNTVVSNMTIVEESISEVEQFEQPLSKTII